MTNNDHQNFTLTDDPERRRCTEVHGGHGGCKNSRGFIVCESQVMFVTSGYFLAITLDMMQYLWVFDRVFQDLDVNRNQPHRLNQVVFCLGKVYNVHEFQNSEQEGVQ